MLVVLAVAFIVENTRQVRIRLLIPEVSMPLHPALGAVIGAICDGYFISRRK